jgi:hypothetical protein
VGAVGPVAPCRCGRVSGMGDERGGATFSVTMLSVLRSRFDEWLAANGLMMAHVPGTDPSSFIVIPVDVPRVLGGSGVRVFGAGGLPGRPVP